MKYGLYIITIISTYNYNDVIKNILFHIDCGITFSFCIDINLLNTNRNISLVLLRVKLSDHMAWHAVSDETAVFFKLVEITVTGKN